MENSLKEQEKLGIKLDKDQRSLVFRMHLLIRANSPTKRSTDSASIRSSREVFCSGEDGKDAADNEAKGKEYREKFAKEKV